MNHEKTKSHEKTRTVSTLRQSSATAPSRRSAPGITGGSAAGVAKDKEGGSKAQARRQKRNAEQRSLSPAEGRRAADTLRALRQIEPSAGRHPVESISEGEADHRRRYSYGV